MLTIRKVQLQALNRYVDQAFEERLLRRLQEKHADRMARLASSETAGDATDAAATFVHEAVTKARGYHLESAPDLTAFVELTLLLGPDFEARPEFAWMSRVLNSKTLPAHTRMRTLFQRLPVRNPQHAGLSYPAEKAI
jgi:hypothetical protein